LSDRRRVAELAGRAITEAAIIEAIAP
jgi:hypothetical protein